jgi:hypothetical protein
MSTMQSSTAYAAALGLSLRQVQRYLAEQRLPGATKVAGAWLIPSDARPVEATSYDVVPVSQPGASYDVAATSSPLGALGTLEDAAELLGTTVGGVRRMAADGLLTVGRYGPRGALRVYVAPALRP